MPTADRDGARARGFAIQLAQDLDAGDVRTVLEVFQQDVARLSRQMESAAAAGDVGMFRRDCHAMAGAAGAVGAADLEEACRRAMTRDDLQAGRLVKVAAEILAVGAAALEETVAFLGKKGADPGK